MSPKHTLLSLCEEYNKIEIPIIQRDYAQGRAEQENVRNRFVDYLVESLSANRKIELDFVYGNVREDIDRNKPNQKVYTFIPIDGQQRLTTLWLLHWFLAKRENCLADIKRYLNKFVYETRPAAHDFCRLIVEKPIPVGHLENISDAIVNQVWFDNEWLKDGTVSGMLQMLKTFGQYPELLNGKIHLSQLLAPNNDITFYFVELKEFGLSEELYIRMNARGKILTGFENFKSEFYKIIKDYDRLDEIKDKMEYLWVENLWDYRGDDYLIDDGFMNYLEFITKMLYFKDAKPRDDKGYASDFRDLRLIKKIYSIPKNIDFLVDALDNIPQIKSFKDKLPFWQRTETLTLPELLELLIKGVNDITTENAFSLYAAILYIHNHKDLTELPYFIRVVRNLAINTDDNSEREWPRILKSLDDFVKVSDIRSYVAKPEFNLIGFYNPQCREEHFKALLLPQYERIIFDAEDNQRFKGYLRPLIASCYVNNAEEIDNIALKCTLKDSQALDFDGKMFELLYASYEIVSENDFESIWGDLICTPMYHHAVNDGRLFYYDNFEVNGAMMVFVKSFAISRLNIEEYSISIEKAFVRQMCEMYNDLKTVRDVKEQLYLLYIISQRVLNQSFDDFFKYKCCNFGWLFAEKGYSSLFTQGIKDDPWFEDVNPIFQTYDSQFRYNMGLKPYHAIDIEIATKPRYDLFDKLIKWALIK